MIRFLLNLQIHFRIEIHEYLKKLFCPDDFTIYLSNAPFLIPLHKVSEKFCSSEFKGDKYNVKVLFFGFTSLRTGVLALSQRRTCRPPPPFRNDPIFFWLQAVRNVLNRTRIWIKKNSDFYFSSYHRKLGWFFRKMTLKWS